MNSQRWTLAVVCAATAMLMLDIAVVNTALSRIAEDLDTGLSGLQWVVDAYTLALASVVLTAGSLADRLGRRRLFTIGLSIFTAASLACAASQDIVFLNSARAVQGVGAAIMFAVSLALLANAYPGAKERAGALAAYGATIGASFAVGPLVGGLLTSGLDWQWIFLINVPIGIACLAITRRYVTESRDPNAHGIDWAGQVTLSAGLFLLVLALLRGNEQGWGEHADRRRADGAAVALAAFVAIERRVAQPMLPLRFFRDPLVHGRADRRVRDLGVVLRDLPLHDDLHAADPRAVGDRGRPRVSARHAGHARGLGRDRLARSEGPGAGDGRRRARSRRRRHGPLHARPGRLVVDRHPAGPADRLRRHRSVQPRADQRGAGLRAAESSGVAAGVNDTYPAGRHRRRRRRPRRADPRRARLRRPDPQAYVNGFHDALLVGGILAAVGAIAAYCLISKSYGAAAEAPARSPRPSSARSPLSRCSKAPDPCSTTRRMATAIRRGSGQLGRAARR